MKRAVIQPFWFTGSIIPEQDLTAEDPTSTREDIYGGDTDIEDSYNTETESDSESTSDHSGYHSYVVSEINYGNIYDSDFES